MGGTRSYRVVWQHASCDMSARITSTGAIKAWNAMARSTCADPPKDVIRPHCSLEPCRTDEKHTIQDLQLLVRRPQVSHSDQCSAQRSFGGYFLNLRAWADRKQSLQEKRTLSTTVHAPEGAAASLSHGELQFKPCRETKVQANMQPACVA